MKNEIRYADLFGGVGGFRLGIERASNNRELLQSFPKNWTKYGINKKGEEVLISDSQRFKMMGNAVTVKVVQAIAQKLLSRK